MRQPAWLSSWVDQVWSGDSCDDIPFMPQFILTVYPYRTTVRVLALATKCAHILVHLRSNTLDGELPPTVLHYYTMYCSCVPSL